MGKVHMGGTGQKHPLGKKATLPEEEGSLSIAKKTLRTR